MKALLFTNIMIFDGGNSALYAGEVLVDEGEIRHVVSGHNQIERSAGIEIVDGGGATLMPGMVEGHAHLTYPFSSDRTPSDITWLDVYSGRIPVEKVALLSAHNAGVLLNAGFTSAYSGGGTTMTMDSALRAEIDAGWIRGPRFRPAGSEGMPQNTRDGPNDVDESLADFVDRGTTEADVRTFVRNSAQAGVDVVKFFLSGPAPGGPHDTGSMYSDELLLAAADQARESGVWLSAHARSAEAIKQGLKCGFRVLYHCDDLDEEGLAMMEERRDEVFVGPSIGAPIAYLELERLKGKAACLDANPFHPSWDLDAEVERQARNCRAMLERGIRLLVGGDYGFDATPHGHNARDLGYFVKYAGMSPLEALEMATKVGGELMDFPVGLVKEGYYADLLLVDGDPLRNIGLLADPEKLLMVMKGGELTRVKEVGPRRTAMAT
jgi:imidazolonepropionase-like amidohydrolase